APGRRGAVAPSVRRLLGTVAPLRALTARGAAGAGARAAPRRRAWYLGRARRAARRRRPTSMITALDALTRLRDGNRRFVEGRPFAPAGLDPARRAALVDGQEPFAIVLGCSDSRVPAEIVFDQGLGDLFVIRVAGNIVAPSQIGSVEF